MTLPLEILDPRIYGDFDKSQIKLINNNKAYDLVLIENATELFRQVMHDQPGNLEKVLKLVVSSADSDCTYLPSETFPYYLYPETKKAYTGKWAQNKQAPQRDYLHVIDTFKQKHLQAFIRKSPCLIGLFAADLLGSGGHYAAYIWQSNGNKLTIFDSMGTVIHRESVYYPFFQQLGKDLFGTPDQLAIPCIKGLISEQLHGYMSLQQTGGFADNIPYQTSIAQQLGEISSQTAAKISEQSTESQNHFCYIWSIWYIHLVLSEWDFDNVLKTIRENSIDPLFVIKRYAWNIFKLAGLESHVKYPQLYEKYFQRVWVNSAPNKNDFEPYQLTMTSCKTANDCLQSSFSPAVLKKVSVTPVPKMVQDAIARQLHTVSF